MNLGFSDMQSELTLMLTTLGAALVAVFANAQSYDYALRPVPAHRVKFGDAFWHPRLEINRTVTIPYSLEMCEETGRIENFRVAAGLSDKKWTGRFGFNDSDPSKIIEGEAYSLMNHPDAKLQKQIGKIIAAIAAAQEDDTHDPLDLRGVLESFEIQANGKNLMKHLGRRV